MSTCMQFALLLCAAMAVASAMSVMPPTSLTVTPDAFLGDPHPILRWDGTQTDCFSSRSHFMHWEADWKFATAASWQPFGRSEDWFPSQMRGASVYPNATYGTTDINVRLRAVCSDFSASSYAYTTYSLNMLASTASVPVWPLDVELNPYGDGWAMIRILRPRYSCGQTVGGASVSNVAYMVQAAPVHFLFDPLSVNLPDSAYTMSFAVPYVDDEMVLFNATGLASSGTYAIRAKLQCSTTVYSSDWSKSIMRSGMLMWEHELRVNQTSAPRWGRLMDRGLRSAVLLMHEGEIPCGVWHPFAETDIEVTFNATDSGETVNAFCEFSPMMSMESSVRQFICFTSELMPGKRYHVHARSVCYDARTREQMNEYASEWRRRLSVETLPPLNNLVTSVTAMPAMPYASVPDPMVGVMEDPREVRRMSVITAPQVRPASFLTIQTSSMVPVWDSKLRVFFYHVYMHASCERALERILDDGREDLIVEMKGMATGSVYTIPYSFPEPGHYQMCIFATPDEPLRFGTSVNGTSTLVTVSGGMVTVIADPALKKTTVSASWDRSQHALIMSVPMTSFAGCHADNASLAYIQSNLFGYGSDMAFNNKTRGWVDVSPYVCEDPLATLANGGHGRLHGAYFTDPWCVLTRTSARDLALLTRIYDRESATASVLLTMRFRTVCSNGHVAPWSDLVRFTVPIVSTGVSVDPMSVQWATRTSLGLRFERFNRFEIGCEHLGLNTDHVEVQYARVAPLAETLGQSTAVMAHFGGGLEFVGGMPRVYAFQVNWTTVNVSSSMHNLRIDSLRPDSAYVVRTRRICEPSILEDEVDRSSSWHHIGVFPTRSMRAHNVHHFVAEGMYRKPDAVVLKSTEGDWGCAWAMSSALNVSVKFGVSAMVEDRLTISLDDTAYGFVSYRTDRGRDDGSSSQRTPDEHHIQDAFLSEQREIGQTGIVVMPMASQDPWIRGGSFVTLSLEETCANPTVRGFPSFRSTVRTRMFDWDLFGSVVPTAVLAGTHSYFSLTAKDDLFGDLYEYFWTRLEGSATAPTEMTCSNISRAVWHSNHTEEVSSFSAFGTFALEAVHGFFMHPGQYALCVRSQSNRFVAFRTDRSTTGYNPFVPAGHPNKFVLTVLPGTAAPASLSSSFLTSISPAVVLEGASYEPSNFTAVTSFTSQLPLVVIPVFVPRFAFLPEDLKTPSCSRVSFLANAVRSLNVLDGFYLLQAPERSGKVYFCVAYARSVGSAYVDSDFVLQTSAAAVLTVNHLPLRLTREPMRLVYRPGSFMIVRWMPDEVLGNTVPGARIQGNQAVVVGLRTRFDAERLPFIGIGIPAKEEFMRSFIVSTGSLFAPVSSVNFGDGWAAIAVPEVLDTAVDVCVTMAIAGSSRVVEDCGVSIFRTEMCGTNCLQAMASNFTGAAIEGHTGAVLTIPPFSIAASAAVPQPFSSVEVTMMSSPAPTASGSSPLVVDVGQASLPALPDRFDVQERHGSVETMTAVARISSIIALTPHGLSFVSGSDAFLDIPVNYTKHAPTTVSVMRLADPSSSWQSVPIHAHFNSSFPHPSMKLDNADAIIRVRLMAFSYYGVYETMAAGSPSSGSSSKSSDGNSVNVAAIVVPIVLAVILIPAGIAGFLFWKKKKKQRAVAEGTLLPVNDPGSAAAYRPFNDSNTL